MKIRDLEEGLDKNQRRVGQVGGEESAKSTGPILGADSKQHPFKGRLVGEDSNEKIADRYDDEEWDEKIQHLKKLAGLGPLKTVWDPVKRVYKNVPATEMPKKISPPASGEGV